MQGRSPGPGPGAFAHPSISRSAKTTVVNGMSPTRSAVTDAETCSSPIVIRIEGAAMLMTPSNEPFRHVSTSRGF